MQAGRWDIQGSIGVREIIKTRLMYWVSDGDLGSS